MAIFNVIIACHIVLTFHIRKTHLPIISFNVREIELNWCSKEQSRKKGVPSRTWSVEAQLPPQALKIYWTELSFFFRMRFSLNKSSANDALAEMSLNELKWAQKSLNELKSI